MNSKWFKTEFEGVNELFINFPIHSDQPMIFNPAQNFSISVYNWNVYFDLAEQKPAEILYQSHPMSEVSRNKTQILQKIKAQLPFLSLPEKRTSQASAHVARQFICYVFISRCTFFFSLPYIITFFHSLIHKKQHTIVFRTEWCRWKTNNAEFIDASQLSLICWCRNLFSHTPTFLFTIGIPISLLFPSPYLLYRLWIWCRQMNNSFSSLLIQIAENYFNGTRLDWKKI